jgi:hypothetical protein
VQYSAQLLAERWPVALRLAELLRDHRADGGNISYINDQSLSCSTEKLTQYRIKAVFKTGVPNIESRTGFGATKTVLATWAVRM